MAKIKPFQAIIYNQEKIKDLSKVACPPYDIISPQRRQYLHEINPYNLIHMLLSRASPQEDKYRRAARYFKDWLKEGMLIQDKSPSIYFYSQQYLLKGEKRTRLGFIGLLRLEEEAPLVFGHEHTRLEPKEDRFRLLKQVKANLSPIFSVFFDKKRIVARTYQNYIRQHEPFIDIIDDEKTAHKVWRIDSSDLIGDFQGSISGENIFIADGHHRYEVACAYRDEMKKKLGDKFNGEEDFNYLLAYFTSTDSHGLTILPVHRLLKLNKQLDWDDFLIRLREYFDVEEVKEKSRFFFLLEKCKGAQHVFGMYKNKKYWLLRLKNVKILDKMFSNASKEYSSVDVAILNRTILNNIFGIDIEDKKKLKFSPDVSEFIEQVDSDPLSLAFFLNPVKIQQIVSVALNGERMPAKSTYFYPKVLSGLVINKHGPIR